MQTLQHIPPWVFVPEDINSLNVAIGISALYGLLSGLRNARALRLLQLSKRHSPNTP